MKKSMYRYMFFDLGTITIIGCILEALVTMMSGYVFTGAPSITFGLLVIMIAVVRWHFWGFTTVPFIAVANMIGGHFNRFSYFSALYDWRVMLSVCVGLLVFIINVIIFKKNGTKRTLNNLWLMLLIITIDYVLFNVIQIGFYNLITSGNPFKLGEILFTYNVHSINETGEKVINPKTVNLCVYEQSEFTFNLIGLRLLIIGTFVLRSQGVLTNAMEKLVEDKQNAELDRMDAENFSISETDEESVTNSAESESEETLTK